MLVLEGGFTMENAETIDLIRASVELIDKLLAMSTGLGSLARKLVAYYVLATYTLPKCTTFPLLVLIGPMGTGKSEAARIIKAFAYKPRAISLRGISPPAFRDELAEANEGTAIIEEADAGWRAESKNYENLFSDRYHRDSAKVAKKISAGEYEWVTQEKSCFGASILHKRLKCADAALEGRSITVQFRANHTRKYIDFSESDPAIVDFKKRLALLTFDPPKLQRSFEAAGRIIASYRPVLAVAEMCGDTDFLDQVATSLEGKTKQLAEDQAVEPDGLVLRAIVESLSTSGGLVFHNVKIKDLRLSVLHNFVVDLQPRQIAALARELGFQTKNSHGFTVVVPTPRTLLNACDATLYEDETIVALRKEVEKPGS
jgi:hypothetical protein